MVKLLPFTRKLPIHRRDREKVKEEIERLKKELEEVRCHHRKPTRVVIELDVDNDEFIKMGLKEKIVQILNK